jgi:hypothetical protein
MSPDADKELVSLDEATVWLTVREQVADARESLAAACDPASLVRLARDLAREMHREIAILESREARGAREALELVDAALSLVCGERAP